MGVDALGGGIVFAIAAALWLVYLIPTWMRSRQYFATERNAVRLQQTLRILAETAEVPSEVRMESAARVISEQKRVLRMAEQAAKSESKSAADVVAKLRRIEAAARREELERQAAEAEAARIAAARARRAQQAALVEANRSGGGSAGRAGQVPQPMSARVLRRLRKLSASLLLAGVLGLVVGVVLAAQGSPLVLVAALITVSMATASLVRLARISVRRPVAQAQLVHAASDIFDVEEFRMSEHATPGTWTPTPLPKPMYLSRGSVASAAMASIEAAADLRRAEDRAELERRAAELAPEVTPITAAASVVASAAEPAPARAPSKFASMGLVDETAAGIDLDAALRRRRAG